MRSNIARTNTDGALTCVVRAVCYSPLHGARRRYMAAWSPHITFDDMRPCGMQLDAMPACSFALSEIGHKKYCNNFVKKQRSSTGCLVYFTQRGTTVTLELRHAACVHYIAAIPYCCPCRSFAIIPRTHVAFLPSLFQCPDVPPAFPPPPASTSTVNIATQSAPLGCG
jgi:hypothetical protein